MSVFGGACEQIKELREAARQFEGYQNGEISRMLRDAADTIESLRERLQNKAFELGMRDAMSEQTCEVVYDGNLRWKCEWCGEVTKGKYADDGKPKRCSECGAFFDEYEEGGAKVVHND